MEMSAPVPVVIRLTWPEIQVCAAVAIARALINIRDGNPPRYGFDGNGLGLDQDFLGAIGEHAVSRYVDARWRFLERGALDVGGYEVRASGWPRLVIHPGDRDDAPFIMVHVKRSNLPGVSLLGWILGRDGKRQEWWGECNPAKPNKREAFWVDADNFHDMKELPRL
jgi:hypothetical protein